MRKVIRDRRHVLAVFPQGLASLQRALSKSLSSNNQSFDSSVDTPVSLSATDRPPVTLNKFQVYKAFPLPGNTSMPNNLLSKSDNKPEKVTLPPSVELERLVKLREFVEESNISPETDTDDKLNLSLQKSNLPVEIVVIPCSRLMKVHLKTLFTDFDVQNLDNVLLLTLAHKTIHDNASWTKEVGEERKAITESFMHTAQALCEGFKHEGYWADFIDPATARPFYGSHTNSSLYETDSIYEASGFVIEQLGCCEIITHKEWGSNVFVGSIFTTMPMDSYFLKKLLAENST